MNLSRHVYGVAYKARFAFLSVVIGIVVGAYPLLWYSRAYFRDDMQAQYMPVFLLIGRGLHHGFWANITLQMQNGGALLNEYQYGVLNPISLISYYVAADSHNLDIASAYVAIPHLAILSAGTYRLARALGACQAFSSIVALTFCSSNFLYYWYASSWMPGLISTAWLVWAIAFLFDAHRGRLQFLLSVVFVYLTVTSGWPQTDVALMLVALVFGVLRLFEGSVRMAIIVAASAACGFALAMPSLLPVLAMTPISSRISAVSSGNSVNINLYDIISVSSPFHFGHFVQLGKGNPILTPMFFAAWYILPLLPFLNIFPLKRPTIIVRMLTILVVAFLLLTQGPESFGPIRLPFRFIPLFDLFVLLLFSILATNFGFHFPTRRRTAAALLVVVFGALGSLQVQPRFWPLILIGMIVVGGLTWLSLLAFRRRSSIGHLTLSLGTVILFAATRAILPANLNLPDWNVASAFGELADVDAVPTHYEFYVGPYQVFRDAGVHQPPFGGMPLLSGRATFSGYSPIGYRGFAQRLCVEVHGSVCPAAAGQLLREPEGRPALEDLLRIDRMVLYKGRGFDLRSDENDAAHWLSIFDGGLPSDSIESFGQIWQVGAGDHLSRTYVRRLPVSWPRGSIAWLSPGLAVAEIGTPRASIEQMRVYRRARRNDRIIFSRIAWPGYYAEFNGRTIPLGVSNDFLLSLTLPGSQQQGVVSLRYRPPYLITGLTSVTVGLLVLTLILTNWSALRALFDDSHKSLLKVE